MIRSTYTHPFRVEGIFATYKSSVTISVNETRKFNLARDDAMVWGVVGFEGWSCVVHRGVMCDIRLLLVGMFCDF